MADKPTFRDRLSRASRTELALVGVASGLALYTLVITVRLWL
jgi:hypothetical protein